MKLDGLHHITMITGDAQRNVEFYAQTLGLRFVKKTVNFDAPEAYHLYFGDEQGNPGSILTWFEFPGAARGRAGLGMIHTITLAVPTADSLGFWHARLTEHNFEVLRSAADTLAFADPDGLRLELTAPADPNPPLQASHPEIPAEHAIAGVHGARAFSAFANVEERLMTDTLGFTASGHGEYLLDGALRHFHFAHDQAPDKPGRQGAGTVHHIAWCCPDQETQLGWQARVREAGGYVTEVRDRDYFTSIYFREPRGVLFEIATRGPGFAVDEDPQHLGEQLRLPEQHEHLRATLEKALTPIRNPRAAVHPPGFPSA